MRLQIETLPLGSILREGLNRQEYTVNPETRSMLGCDYVMFLGEAQEKRFKLLGKVTADRTCPQGQLKARGTRFPHDVESVEVIPLPDMQVGKSVRVVSLDKPISLLDVQVMLDVNAVLSMYENLPIAEGFKFGIKDEELKSQRFQVIKTVPSPYCIYTRETDVDFGEEVLQDKQAKLSPTESTQNKEQRDRWQKLRDRVEKQNEKADMMN